MSKLSDFPRYFKCPCGSDKRVSMEATKAVFPSHVGNTQMGHDNPIRIGSTSSASIVTRGIVCSWDICFDCGRRYYHRVEIIQGTPSVPPEILKRNN